MSNPAALAWSASTSWCLPSPGSSGPRKYSLISTLVRSKTEETDVSQHRIVPPVVPPVGFEPTLETGLGRLPLPLGYGGSSRLADVPPTIGRRLRVAVRAEEPQVLESVVVGTAVDVIELKGNRLAVPKRTPPPLARRLLDACANEAVIQPVGLTLRAFDEDGLERLLGHRPPLPPRPGPAKEVARVEPETTNLAVQHAIVSALGDASQSSQGICNRDSICNSARDIFVAVRQSPRHSSSPRDRGDRPRLTGRRGVTVGSGGAGVVDRGCLLGRSGESRPHPGGGLALEGVHDDDALDHVGRDLGEGPA